MVNLKTSSANLFTTNTSILPYPSRHGNIRHPQHGWLLPRDQEKETVQRWLKRWEEPDTWLYVVPGLATGEHLAPLLDGAPGATALVLERDKRMSATVFGNGDFKKYTDDQRLLILDDKDRALSQITGLLGDKIVRKVTLCGPLAQYDNEWWAEQLPKLHDFQEQQRTSVMTSISNAGKTCQNLIDNLPDYIRWPTVIVHKDAHLNQPAICIGAGPSIEDQLEILREYQDRAVLISCATMAKPLQENGIYPRFFTALDYHELSGLFLYGVDSSAATLILDPKVNHAVPDNWKGQSSFIGNSYLDSLAGLAEDPEAYLPQGGNVGHLSVALAQYIGCDPILLAGTELGYKPNVYYPECLYKAHPWKRLQTQNHMVNMVTRVLKDIHGETICTDEQMQCYRYQFEQMYRQRTGTWYDCTPAGVPREIGEKMDLAEAAGKFLLTSVIAATEDVFQIRPPVEVAIRALKQRLPRFKRMARLEKRLAANLTNALDRWDDEDHKARRRRSVRLLVGKLKGLYFEGQLAQIYSGTADLTRHWLDTDRMRRTFEDKDDEKRAKVRDDLEFTKQTAVASQAFYEYLAQKMEEWESKMIGEMIGDEVKREDRTGPKGHE